jgi:NAD(P)-dependent dehydrogenase (short-subunit alcohol dehydrogenase family)
MTEAPPFPSPTQKWHIKAQPSTSPTRPELSAKGKSIIITGGGSTGIGGETARYFAAAGASRIALLGRREKPLLDNKAFISDKFPDVEVFTISTDVTKKSDVDGAFAQFAGKGKINVLVHAAAAVGPKETVADVNGEAYLACIQTNVAGSLWVAQAFLCHAAPDAVAIAINSWGAHLSLNDAFASYCVAKLAVYRLWDTVALANPNLSVFHTQPGVILTEMNLSVGGAESFKDVKTDDGKLRRRC